jgi:glucose-6-phosphate isomerase
MTQWGFLETLPANGTILKQQAGTKGLGSDDGQPVRLEITNVFEAPGDPNPITRSDLEELAPEVVRIHRELKAGGGDVRDGDTVMLGWQDLPERIDADHLERVRATCAELSCKIDAYVSLGIGGSYLGIEATVCALRHTHFNQLTRAERGGAPEIYFLGQNMDPDFFRDTLDCLRGKRVGLNVISKSGTTTETAIAFRILRRLVEQAGGEAAKDLILVTTDAHKGVLRRLADEKGYRSFVVPSNIGGRFSVLSDVGLVGIAMAGIDIAPFVAGFRQMKQRSDGDDFWRNPALVHAAVRTLAYWKGKKVEVVATNSLALFQVARFMEQLFPESEGHRGRGLWVSPSMYSEKLHANGQMVQEGERNLIETFLRLARHDSTLPIPRDDDDADDLNYLRQAGHDLASLNGLAIDGPAYAHYQGGVPNMTIHLPERSAHCLGQLYYMLERSVAISGRLLGHNPFIQPGVVAYKDAIFALAGKPGFEAQSERMRQARRERQALFIE